MIGNADIIGKSDGLSPAARPRLAVPYSPCVTDNSPFLGLHHVLIGVPPDQKDEAHRFYEQVLGFEPLESPLESSPTGNMWWYRCGDAEFHVALVPDYQPNRRPHPAIRVRDLAALRERLRGHGIATKLDYSYVGCWRVYVTDPWDNRIEFIEPLPPGAGPPTTP